MDFFEHQDVARKNTGRLVLYFALAVVGIVVLTYLAIVVILGYAQTKRTGEIDPARLFDPLLVLGVGTGVVAVIGLGSAYKIAQLRAGGHVVAEMLGGRRLDRGSIDPDERKLLNVVEEMALASGTPVPPVFVMDHESGINAFAAGHTPSDAVIGVTRGCMKLLTRDELQGVVAHEFSHVLNGDMRLNVRLMGVIHGILLIGLLGYMVLRTGVYAPRSRSREKGGGAVAILALGAALTAIGFVGTFFGNLIKAAVSRQREFLADASAVQFTRNPDGIAGALKKIGGYEPGSRLLSQHAAEVSHMLFGAGVVSHLGSLHATHPPLVERIRRIDPGFDGKFPAVAPPAAEAERRPAPAARRELAPAARALAAIALAEQATTVALVGQPTPEHLEYAQRLMEDLPAWAKAAAREPYQARALVYALLLDEKQPERLVQLQRLEAHAEHGLRAVTEELSAQVRGLDPRMRLPLIDLANAALRELSPRQYQAFRGNVLALIHVDDRVDPFEWILQRLVLQHLDASFGDPRPRAAQYYSLNQLTGPCSVLLSALARADHADGDTTREAFGKGAAVLEGLSLELRPAEAAGPAQLDEALDALDAVTPRLKREVLRACAACIAADRSIGDEEAELFRAFAASLGCPVPPVLPGQPLA